MDLSSASESVEKSGPFEVMLIFVEEMLDGFSGDILDKDFSTLETGLSGVVLGFSKLFDNSLYKLLENSLSKLFDNPLSGLVLGKTVSLICRLFVNWSLII
jgi:hypothetical protein